MEHVVLDKILKTKVIAIVRGISCSQIGALAAAIRDGGLCCMEVTFDHGSKEGIENTLDSIRLLKTQFGNTLCIGAGTVLSAEEVRQAQEAGAGYIISPNTDEFVIRETKRLGLVSIPGAMTATEIAYANQCGADLVKVFPAGVLGTDYIKAIRAPLNHISLTAVGGITVQNAPAFLKAGAVGVGVGGNLVSPTLVAEGRFDQITQTAREYADAVRR